MSEKKVNPPRLAEFFLRQFLPEREKQDLLGDYEEYYKDILNQKGRFISSLWYWLQIINLIPRAMWDSIKWSLVVMKNYLKITLRNIKRHCVYTVINITGLTLGLTCCILIFLFVNFELSYDKYHANSNNIFRVVMRQKGNMRMGTDCFNSTPGGLKNAIVEDFPEVLKSTRAFQRSGNINKDGELIREQNITYADPEFLEMFTFAMITGDPKTALREPFSILLTAEMASKYFGFEDPIGKMLSIDNNEYKVTGIMENIPANTRYPFDFLASFKTIYTIYRSEERVEAWNTGNQRWNTYILLSEYSDPVVFEKKLIPFIKKYRGENINQEFVLQALTRIHLHSHTRGEIGVVGDMKTVYLFSIIAFFILLIACLNYMNLSTARSSKRAREIGIRKVVGAHRSNLIYQLLSESLFLVLIAFGISIVLVKMLLPTFNSLIDRELEFVQLLYTSSLLGISGILILTGFFAGSYSAFYLSSCKPLIVIKNTFSCRSNRLANFRNILVNIQFVISIVLIICTMVMVKQMNFIRKKDLGYRTDHIIYGYGGRSLRLNFEAFKNELIKNPQIQEVYVGGNLPISILANNNPFLDGKDEREDWSVYCGAVGYDFLEFFNIDLIEGRSYTKEFSGDAGGTYLINETLAKMAGWENPIGKKLNVDHEESREVIGVFKDFHNTSLHSTLEPMAIYLRSPKRSSGYYAVKIHSSDIPAVLSYLKKQYLKFSQDYPFQYSFLNERIDRMYKVEHKLGKSFYCFSLIAIIIASLGLFGLVTFTAEQKIKEIGIRKVLGASVLTIVQILSKKFLTLVLLANIVAWPIAYYAMNRWLQNFVYRTNLNLWIFIYSGSVALIIALFTISYQTIRAAWANPVDSLRYE